MITGREIYVEGKKTDSTDLKEMRETCRRRGGMAWVSLEEPTEEELVSVADEFGFHPLAVEDAVEAHQRPKVEHYGETIFVVLRSAKYLDETESVVFGEVHLFVGRDFVVTVRHGGTESLSAVKRGLESEPEMLGRGPLAVLYAVMDHVVDGYSPVLDGLENDIDEVEAEVFAGSADGKPSQRVYLLSRQIMQFHRVTRPMSEALDGLREENVLSDREMRRYFRDVRDHSSRVNERVEGLRDLVSNILSVNLSIVGAEQNDQTKRISAWAAILIVPTIVTGIYGMNFDYMPELAFPFGYPASLVLMFAISFFLYRSFKRRGWL